LFLKIGTAESCPTPSKDGRKIKMRKFLPVVMGLFLAIGAIMLPQRASAGSYYGSNAAAYALTYCDDYNPAYTSFESDCTNFVSQCLLAGGWTETGKYSYSSSSAWYYDGSYYPLLSQTWIWVENFKQFIEGSGRVSGPITVNSSSLPWFQVGDVIIVDWTNNGSWDHAYIVTGLTSNPSDVELAAHTTDRCGNITTADIWDDYYPNAVMKGYFLYSSY
jgi:hypothetical protein